MNASMQLTHGQLAPACVSLETLTFDCPCISFALKAVPQEVFQHAG